MRFVGIIFSPFYLLFFGLITFFSFPVFIPFFILKKCKKDQIAYRYAYAVGRVAAFLYLYTSFARIKIEGRQNLPKENRRICFIANHRGLADILLITLAIPFPMGYIAKKESFQIPIFKWWLKMLNCVSLDRGSPRDSVRAILSGVEKIKGGVPLLIFPEGTRSNVNKMRRFKAGSFKLAYKSQATVIPITVDGGDAYFERYRHFLPFQKMRVVIHQAIEFEEYESIDEVDFVSQVFLQIKDGFLTPVSTYLDDAVDG